MNSGIWMISQSLGRWSGAHCRLARPRMLSVCDVTRCHQFRCGTMSVLMTTSGQQHPILIVFRVFSSLAIARMFPGSRHWCPISRNNKQVSKYITACVSRSVSLSRIQLSSRQFDIAGTAIMRPQIVTFTSNYCDIVTLHLGTTRNHSNKAGSVKIRINVSIKSIFLGDLESLK